MRVHVRLVSDSQRAWRISYNGLNRRITRTIGSDDPIHEYYTESWQRIESRPNGESSTQGVSLFVFGIRSIDDSGAWASRPPSSFLLHANASGPPEERRYFLTDTNYNVSMIVTDAARGGVAVAGFSHVNAPADIC